MKILIPLAACVLAVFRLHASPITVFAAASLTDALQQIAAEYQQSSGDQIVFNFAASGVLARQIEASAPAEIFFSADEAQMDKLAAKDLIVSESRRNILGNSLVIITAPDSPATHSIRVPQTSNSAVSQVSKPADFSVGEHAGNSQPLHASHPTPT